MSTELNSPVKEALHAVIARAYLDNTDIRDCAGGRIPEARVFRRINQEASIELHRSIRSNEMMPKLIR